MMLEKQKRYLAQWLGISAEQFEHSRGVVLTATPKRGLATDSVTKMGHPLYAFRVEDKLFVSCIPELEEHLRGVLKEADPSTAMQKMSDYFDREEERFCAFSSSAHTVFGLDEFSRQVDTDKAVMLTGEHYEQYSEYYLTKNPIFRKMQPEKWMPGRFEQIVDRGNDFFLFEDGAIVSGTEASEVPYMPDEIIELGVDTLKNYRRKGYAFTVCVAFIQHHLQQGKALIWICEVDNTASELLARKLGFACMGEEYMLCTLSANEKFVL